MRPLDEVVDIKISHPNRYVEDERAWSLDKTMLNRVVSDQGSKDAKEQDQSLDGITLSVSSSSKVQTRLSPTAGDADDRWLNRSELSTKPVAGKWNETQSIDDENDVPGLSILKRTPLVADNELSAKRVKVEVDKTTTSDHAHSGGTHVSADGHSTAKPIDEKNPNQTRNNGSDEKTKEFQRGLRLPSSPHINASLTESPQHTRSQAQDISAQIELEPSPDDECSDDSLSSDDISTDNVKVAIKQERETLPLTDHAHLELPAGRSPRDVDLFLLDEEKAVPKQEDTIIASTEGGSQPEAPLSSTHPVEIIPWTTEQHRAFVSAVFEIGLKNCSPSVIMDVMKNIPININREKTKSHLQKFRKTFDRSVAEFMEEYDDFMILVEEQRASKPNGVINEQIHDSAMDEQKVKVKTETDTEAINEDPAALLEAALDGMDPDDLLGGTAAAHAAYSVANNFPTEDDRNKIPYDAFKEDFPVLSEDEAGSVIGKSLMKVKGALEFVAEFVLKKRHGIPMKLDRKTPPFLEKDDIALVAPYFGPTGTDRQGGSVPFSQQGAASQAQPGMYPMVPSGYPHFMAPGNHHPVYNQERGSVPDGRNQPAFTSFGVPSGTLGYLPVYGGPVPMSAMHTSRTPNGPPYMGEPFANQLGYPPHFLQQQGQVIPLPGMQTHYGYPMQFPMNHPGTHGNPYAPMYGHPSSQHHPPAYQHSHHSGGNLVHSQESYEYHYDSQPYEATSAAWPSTDVSSTSFFEHHADDTRHRRAHRGSGNDRKREKKQRHCESQRAKVDSPPPSSRERSNLRKISEATPPSTQHSFSSDLQDQSVDRDRFGSGRKRSRMSYSHHSRISVDLDGAQGSATKLRPENSIFTSPISSSVKSRNKKPWSPSPPSPTGHEEMNSSERPQRGIFRVGSTSSPATKRDGRERELERPSSSLSFNLEELGLHPSSGGTPGSEAARSPMSLALRDVPWDLPSTDSIKDRHRHRPSRNQDSSQRMKREEDHERQQEQAFSPRYLIDQFSPGGDITGTPPSSGIFDKVELDSGMIVSTPGEEYEDDGHH